MRLIIRAIVLFALCVDRPADERVWHPGGK